MNRKRIKDFDRAKLADICENEKKENDLKESVLAEAERLINGDRQVSYSHPHSDYMKTVGAFNALTGHNLSVRDGILFMVCVKLSRQAFKHKRDNIVDACGYLGCLEKVIDREDEIKGGTINV